MGKHRQGQPKPWKLRGQIHHLRHCVMLDHVSTYCKYIPKSISIQAVHEGGNRGNERSSTAVHYFRVEEQGGNWQSAMQYHEKALERLGKA